MVSIHPELDAQTGGAAFLAAAQRAGRIDPIEAVLAAGLAPLRPLNDEEAIAEAERLMVLARRDSAYRVTLPDMLAILAAAPHLEAVHHSVAELLALAGDRGAAFACWRGIVARFPRSGEAWRRFLETAVGAHGPAAAATLLRLRFPRPETMTDPIERLILAQGLEATGAVDEAEAAYLALTRDLPGEPLPWLRLATLRRTRGSLAEAHAILVRSVAEAPGPELDAALAEAAATLSGLASAIPVDRLEAGPAWQVALDHLLATLVDQRRRRRPRLSPTIGGIVLVGGSLGGGGAERQLVASALALTAAAAQGRSVGAGHVAGPVAILCRRLDTRLAHDFFLPRLAAAGVPVASYLGTRPYGGSRAASVVGRHAALVMQLPPRMREGLLHLADLLRLRAPDVVHIWQDGMIVAAGLAALIAEVPHIVLNVRTLPPTDRADRLSPGQHALYRALLSTPGVSLTANSAIAARRYEAWLGLARGIVQVVPNGVAPLPADGDDAEQERWRQFAERTGDGFVMGGVMRLDGNKRPLDWLGVAEALARRRPDARFVLVGDGQLRREVEEFAAHRGLLDRLLLVGRSAHVGFWLAHMDALLLTSRFEGTPNVLIEAQAAGLPVVTTPAGGAAETLVPGVTGIVLPDAETIDTEAAAAALVGFAALPPDERAHRADLARAWADRRYSMETMLARTLDIFASPPEQPLLGD